MLSGGLFSQADGLEGEPETQRLNAASALVPSAKGWAARMTFAFLARSMPPPALLGK